MPGEDVDLEAESRPWDEELGQFVQIPSKLGYDCMTQGPTRGLEHVVGTSTYIWRPSPAPGRRTDGEGASTYVPPGTHTAFGVTMYPASTAKGV